MNSCSKLCREGTLDAEKVKGKIVVCLEDKFSAVLQGSEAASAGAVGMVLANDGFVYFVTIGFVFSA